MVNWQAASEYELKQYQAIHSFLSHRVNIIHYLFHNERPILNNFPDKIITDSEGFCSSDKVLIRVALQLWCDYGQIGLYELFCLDGEVFLKVLKAIEDLGPKPSSWYSQLMSIASAEEFK